MDDFNFSGHTHPPLHWVVPWKVHEESRKPLMNHVTGWAATVRQRGELDFLHWIDWLLSAFPGSGWRMGAPFRVLNFQSILFATWVRLPAVSRFHGHWLLVHA
jgi:hypothetical protein